MRDFSCLYALSEKKMPKFTDTINIRIKAGDGGAGAVSFRREKYIAKGGPDGGDGGNGGNVYIEADRRYYNLSHFFRDRLYKARRGHQGEGRNRHGADGDDVTLLVPPGTQVIDAESGEIIADLVSEEDSCLVAKGGIGGKGNAFFKSSTHQTPRMAQPGSPGEEKILTLNLKLIADIGLVGLPNAGKSTLLSTVTRAKPKIADYPFTTLIPNLGVVQRSKREFLIADIPGIIEGAHRGHGLGLSFLQHIERVNVLLFLLDATEEELPYTLELLRSELKAYNEELLERPSLVLLSKVDLIDEDELKEKAGLLKGEEVIPVSSVTGKNIEKLIDRLILLLEEAHAAEGSDTEH